MAILAGAVFSGAPLPASAAAAGSMASTIPSAPVRPATCTAAQLAALDIDGCALYANGNPDDHGFSTPPFPRPEIVTTPIAAEQWVPLALGSSGTIVTLLQRALRSVAPTLGDDGTFGANTDTAVRLVQTQAALEVTGVVDAALAERLGILVTATTVFPGPGWVFDGNTYNASPILAEWEARMVKGKVRGDPDIQPLFEGFLAQLHAGSLRVDEFGAYGFRCVATSVRDCRGQGVDELSYHAWGAAVDVNWTQNPLQTVSHESDACGAPGELAWPEWVIKTAQHWGLYWGGWYSCPRSGARSVTKDPHHFEFRGTPELARRILAKNTAAGAVAPTVPGIGDLLLSCGDRGAGVVALRSLLAPGDRPAETESVADTFTPTLATALGMVQTRLGLLATGALDRATAGGLGVVVTHTEAFPVLHTNSCGEPVRALQRAIGVTVTGLFNSTTLNQLRTWQRAHGLAPTGVTDTMTAAALGLQLSADTAPAVPTTTTGPPPSTVDPSAAKVVIPLKPGTRSKSVTALQRALTAAGYPTPVTGKFGTVTTKNLRAFKVAAGLPATTTLTKAAADRLGLVPIPRIPTRYGERGEHVLILQNALRAAGFDVAADGRFGKATRLALRALQEQKGLKVTGMLDTKTAKTLGW